MMLALIALALCGLGIAEGSFESSASTPLFAKAMFEGLRAGVSAHRAKDSPPLAFAEGLKAVHDYLAPHEAEIRAGLASRSGSSARVGRLGSNSLPGPYFRVIPAFLGSVSLDGSSTLSGVESRCFDHLSVSVAAAPPKGSSGEVTVEFTATHQNSTLCEDLFLLAFDGELAFMSISSPGVHNATISIPSLAGGADAAWELGLNVHNFVCDGVLGCASDLLATVGLFVPSLTDRYLSEASEAENVAFLESYTDFRYPNRSTQGLTPGLDESKIQTGDLMVIFRADGLASLEGWGSGDISSHIAMFYEFEEETQQGLTEKLLYVVESTDSTNFWPGRPNIQKTLYDPTWKQLAMEANYSIALLPLKDELRKKFNYQAAEDYIASALGNPYGYHNFLWTFFDVYDANLPWPASWQAIENLFGFLETIDEALVQQFVTLAAEKRLNSTESLTIPQVSLAAKKQLNLNFGQLMALPEQDAWVYPDGPSLVCDSFAAVIYKFAGLFDSLTINGAEFTNSGLYTANFFDVKDDKHDPRQDACVKADPELPYCMLMGNLQLHLYNVSTITPYNHMQEHCSALPPDYINPDHC